MGRGEIGDLFFAPVVALPRGESTLLFLVDNYYVPLPIVLLSLFSTIEPDNFLPGKELCSL